MISASDIIKLVNGAGFDYSLAEKDIEVPFSALGIDSLGAMDIFLLIEETYGRHISDEEASKINNFKKLADLLNA